MKRIFLGTLFLFLIFMYPFRSFALKEDTHKAINEAIAQRSINGFSLDEYLMRQLGISQGKNQELVALDADNRNVTKSIYEWLGYGGEQEDRPGSFLDYLRGKPSRSNNHFHNPLKTWDQAGLNDKVFLVLSYTGQSQVLWAQKSNQTLGGNWAWQDARRYFYIALTGQDLDGTVLAKTQADRDAYYAYTFRAIGQLMHLVEDASVPAHVRNNAHPEDSLGIGYESAVENFRTKPKYGTLWNDLLSSPISFDKSILDIPTISSAPVPISRIVDTDIYTGQNPETTTNPRIGMSEYTNANFLSPKTMFTDDLYPTDLHYFPYPKGSSAALWTDATNNRTYLKKITDGERVDHLATTSILYSFRRGYFPQYNSKLPVGLDDKCYQEYASLLLPRAVGYSAGLLNYFFRGDIRLSYQTGSTPGYVIVNKTNEGMKGLFQVFYDDKETGRTELWRSENLTIFASGQSGRVDFAIPDIDKATEPGKYILVFKGKMGNEVGAVVGNISGRTLEITPPDRYVYSIIDGSIEPQQFTKLKAKIKNTSNEEIKAGTLQAVAKYRKRTDYEPDLSADPPDPVFIEDDYSYSVSDAVPVASLSTTDATEIPFSFINNPIPTGITDLYLQVIFTGTISNEVNIATAMGTRDLMEPTHHVFWNNTDMVSLNGDLYTAFQIRENPELMKLVGNDNIDPEVLTYRIAYFGQNPPPANLYDSVIAENIPAGRYIRLISLLDKQRGNHGRLAWDDTTGRLMLAFSGAKNQEERGVFRYTPVTTFRNIRQHYFEGVIECEPAVADPSTGNRYCAYPEAEAIIPPDLTPYPVTTVFP